MALLESRKAPVVFSLSSDSSSSDSSLSENDLLIVAKKTKVTTNEFIIELSSGNSDDSSSFCDSSNDIFCKVSGAMQLTSQQHAPRIVAEKRMITKVPYTYDKWKDSTNNDCPSLKSTTSCGQQNDNKKITKERKRSNRKETGGPSPVQQTNKFYANIARDRKRSNRKEAGGPNPAQQTKKFRLNEFLIDVTHNNDSNDSNSHPRETNPFWSSGDEEEEWPLTCKGIYSDTDDSSMSSVTSIDDKDADHEYTEDSPPTKRPKSHSYVNSVILIESGDCSKARQCIEQIRSIEKQKEFFWNMPSNQRTCSHRSELAQLNIEYRRAKDRLYYWRKKGNINRRQNFQNKNSTSKRCTKQVNTDSGRKHQRTRQTIKRKVVSDSHPSTLSLMSESSATKLPPQALRNLKPHQCKQSASCITEKKINSEARQQKALRHGSKTLTNVPQDNLRRSKALTSEISGDCIERASGKRATQKSRQVKENITSSGTNVRELRNTKKGNQAFSNLSYPASLEPENVELIGIKDRLAYREASNAVFNIHTRENEPNLPLHKAVTRPETKVCFTIGEERYVPSSESDNDTDAS